MKNAANKKYEVVKTERGYKYKHRLVVEEFLGRPLVKGEEVHHIDMNPSNNVIENLTVMSRSNHLKLHSQFESIIGELYKMGVITFSKETNTYSIENSLRSNQTKS